MLELLGLVEFIGLLSSSVLECCGGAVLPLIQCIGRRAESIGLLGLLELLGFIGLLGFVESISTAVLLCCSVEVLLLKDI